MSPTPNATSVGPLSAPDVERVPLAVIVPAFKSRFLLQALNSLAAQTNQRNRIYIFDDASKENLEIIYRASHLYGRPNVVFERFADNLGGVSLARHWNRCVTGTSDEPWVWLFSDDDLADPECVQAFYDALHEDEQKQVPADIYRFNTVLIDEENGVNKISPPHPARETSIQFAYHKLVNQRNSYAPEHIFSRAAFEREKGFVEFPFAMGSDDASWMVFAAERPLRGIEGAHVYWRQGTSNTSRLAGPQAVDKLLALCDYALWLQQRFGARPPLPSRMATMPDMRQIIEKWLLTHLSHTQKILSPTETERIVSYVHEKLGTPKNFIRAKALQAIGRMFHARSVTWLKARLSR